MSANFVKKNFLMQLGQNVHFNDINMLKLLFFKFFQKLPDFPIFSPEEKLWVNFGLNFLIGKPNEHLLMYWYEF